MKFELSGHFWLRAVNAETGAVRELGEFDNLILDGGLNRLGTGGVMGYCVVGSGSTAPANSDTTLVAAVASTSDQTSISSGQASSSPYYGYQRRTYRFGMGVAAGNLSEVGIGWTPTNLFSRALILDTGGTPTTITVLSNEFLDVTYELRVYAPTTDVTGTVSIGGVSTNFVARAAAVTDIRDWECGGIGSGVNFGTTSGSDPYCWFGSGALGTVTQRPSGTSENVTNSRDSYANNSLAMTGGITAGLDVANFAGGITTMLVRTTLGTFQASFSPPIAKDNTKTLRVNVSVSWGRHA